MPKAVMADHGGAQLSISARHGAPLRTVLFTLLRMAAFKDFSTSGHLRRVRLGTIGIAALLRGHGRYRHLIDETFLENLSAACTLHDIGKIQIPDAILLKPGQLNAPEIAAMQIHTTLGGRLLADAAHMLDANDTLSMAADIAFAHHEHFDGRGYPRGLTGDDIPLSARIVAVIDVFDALVSRRPYKEPWDEDRAAAFLATQAGMQFDPIVVEAFLLWRQSTASPFPGVE